MLRLGMRYSEIDKRAGITLFLRVIFAMSDDRRRGVAITHPLIVVLPGHISHGAR